MSSKVNFILVAVITLSITGLMIVGLLYATPQSNPSRARHEDCCSDEDSGAIEGYVYDPDGQPVNGATISVERTDAIMRGLPSAVSDDRGKFLIKDLPPGPYLVVGRKEADGYPRTDSPFYYQQVERIVPPHVNVTQGKVTPDVGVRLGQKVAKLVLRVYDTETSKLIQDARVVLRHTDNPNYSSSSSINHLADSEFEILSPTVPFSIEISAPGYAVWRYTGKEVNQASEALQLSKGEIKRMTVALPPAK